VAVFGRTEGHVAATQGEIFTGDYVAAVHVKLVSAAIFSGVSAPQYFSAM
jgi:hypothetical protein